MPSVNSKKAISKFVIHKSKPAEYELQPRPDLPEPNSITCWNSLWLWSGPISTTPSIMNTFEFEIVSRPGRVGMESAFSIPPMLRTRTMTTTRCGKRQNTGVQLAKIKHITQRLCIIIIIFCPERGTCNTVDVVVRPCRYLEAGNSQMLDRYLHYTHNTIRWWKTCCYLAANSFQPAPDCMIYGYRRPLEGGSCVKCVIAEYTELLLAEGPLPQL